MSTRASAPLLVVAGEASGDALGAPVVSALGAPAFGIGGPALAAAGVELVSGIDGISAMGVRAAVESIPALIRALARVSRETLARRPRAALLVGFSEVNARLAAWLSRRGVRVLWYAPPQVWAWRPGRARRIARAVDRLAVLLPFEAAIWRRAGARAEYVGHPAVGRARPTRRIEPSAPLVALLPGSRRREVHAHLRPMLEALDRIRRIPRYAAVRARLVLSRALPATTTRSARELAARRGVPTVPDPIHDAIADAHAALVSSGTATLECAALGVPPAIVYRTDPVTHAVATRLVRVPYIGLPNLVLGRAAFPELIQRSVTRRELGEAAIELLDHRAGHLAACEEVRQILSEGLGIETAGERVARMLLPWLG